MCAAGNASLVTARHEVGWQSSIGPCLHLCHNDQRIECVKMITRANTRMYLAQPPVVMAACTAQADMLLRVHASGVRALHSVCTAMRACVRAWALVVCCFMCVNVAAQETPPPAVSSPPPAPVVGSDPPTPFRSVSRAALWPCTCYLTCAIW